MIRTRLIAVGAAIVLTASGQAGAVTVAVPCGCRAAIPMRMNGHRPHPDCRCWQAVPAVASFRPAPPVCGCWVEARPAVPPQPR